MPAEEREGVALTNLDQPLFDGAGATKRDLLDYLDAMSDRLLPELRDRPLSVVRVHRGEDAFMQKNVPKHTPGWVRTVTIWAEASRRDVRYAVCDDRPTLLWFGNQRAVEYHPTLVRVGEDHPDRLVLDLDPPAGAPFATVVAVAHLVREVLDDLALASAVKTTGSKGVHIVVPLEPASFDDVAAATRAIAERAVALEPTIATTAFVKDDRQGKVFVDATRVGGATVVSAYSPRVRQGVTVSFPVAWAELDAVDPSAFTIRTAPGLLDGADPWGARLPSPQPLPSDLVAEGRTIPVARVQAMQEGKRRARTRRGGG